jgi:HEAT repeat protein
MVTTRIWRAGYLIIIGLGLVVAGCGRRSENSESPVVLLGNAEVVAPSETSESLPETSPVPPQPTKTESPSSVHEKATEGKPVSSPTQPSAVSGGHQEANKPEPKPTAELSPKPTAQPKTPAVPAQPESAAKPRAAVKSVASLREELASSTNPDATITLTDEIGRLRGRGRAALPELVGLTANADPRIRWHAARAIGLVGEDAISAIPTLFTLLQDADPVVATQAAAAIGHIREDDSRNELPADVAELYDDAVTQLVAMLVHNDPRVRRASLRALRELDPDPEALMPVVDAIFAGSDPSVILPALNSIADMGGDAVPFLVERLKRPQGRYWASVAITEIGPAAAAATPALIDALAASPPEEQLQQILALAAIGEGAQAAGDTLLKLYAEEDEALRGPLLYALGQLKITAAEPLLAETVAAGEPWLAAAAAWARANIAPDDAKLVADAVARLTKQTASELEFERAAAVSGLSDLAIDMEPDQQRELGEHFGDLLEDSSDQVHHAAGAALVRLGGEAVPALIERLSDSVTQRNALEIIAAIGPPAAPAAVAVMPLLDADDPDVVVEAALALAAVGPKAGPAVERLVALLDEARQAEGQTALQYALIYALGRIGPPEATPALESLSALSASSDAMAATMATWAALQIDPDNQDRYAAAVPLLTKGLESESQTVRLEAAVALGDLGPKAAVATPALEFVAEDDPIANIRTAARQALAKIGG